MARRPGRWDYFPKSTPIEVEGGIKAASQRGEFGQNWWSKRWNQVLEGFDLGARLGRGRAYARRGQVMEIDVAAGKVTAQVQGSRPRPYAVRIQVQEIPAATWKKLAAALAGEVRFMAKLLAGEMPQEIEEVFRAAGVGLFPQQAADLATDCSCPDWSNPCKHIAAVYLLLGEVFDQDPFLIFKLRGLERTELMTLLGGVAAKTKGTAAAAVQPTAPEAPLSADPARFWRGGEIPADLFGDVAPVPVDGVLLKRLGSLPLWRGNRPMLEALGEIYPLAAQRGLALFIGEPPSNTE